MNFGNWRNGLVLVLGLAAVSPGQVRADGAPGVEAGLSTQGIYVAPTFGLASHLDLRSSVYFGTLSGGVHQSGAELDGTVKSQSLSLMADFQPGASGIRLSGGIAYGGYSLNGTMNSVTLDGNLYPGTFDVSLAQQNPVAPVLSIGYSKAFSNGWSLTVELGGKFVRYDMNAVPSSSLGPAQAQFDADLAAVNASLHQFNVTPFATIGAGFRF